MAWISWEKLCAPKACGGMGFKQFKQFNLAMLAKQGWRVQTGTGSLLYRVFKSKYFLNCEFVDASLGRNPSFAWRSIMAAQALVQKGRRWQVGNDRSIMFWKDKWLPSPFTYEVISPVNNIPEDSRVVELIDEEKGAWKTDLVCNVFLPHEVNLICGIALCANMLEDKQVWALTNNGFFSVRSAYKLVIELRSDAQVGIRSDGSHLRRFWRTIWSCNIPHKICHFAWRACRDVLPTEGNLARRKVLSNSCCDECKLAEETLGHLFWSCQRAREIWWLSTLFQESRVQHFGLFMDMLWYVVMVAQWEHSDVEKLIMVA